jgi:5'-nucleotidase / UDP-sugar diphosphatase
MMMKTSIGAVMLLGASALAQPGRVITTATPSATPAQAVSVAVGNGVLEETQPLNTVDFWLHVLHNNDGESRVLPLTGAQLGFGGAARFKTLVDVLKVESASYPVDGAAKGFVMISSGDNILPGINLNAAINNGVPYYDSTLLDLIGYDAVTLGNHDFDANPDVLANLIAGTNSTGFISANLGFAAEPGLQAQVTAGKLSPSRVVNVNGRLIGIVGGTTELLRTISSPRNTQITAVVPALQAEIDRLTSLGVKIIIVSTHLQGLSSELAVIPQLRDVDVVIAGGGSEIMANAGDLLVPGDVATHPYPVYATSLSGAQVPVVTTVGDYKYVGRLIVGFDADGNVLAVDGESRAERVSGIAPDAVPGDAAVQSLVVDPVQAANDALASNIIAVSEVPLDSSRPNIRVRETNAGNLVADSQLWEAQRIARANGLPVPQISLQNGGGIRINAVQSAGNITEKYTYDQLPFANTLAIVPNVSPVKLKELLENAVSNVEGVDGRFAYISGMRIVWDAAQQRQLVRVASTLPDGTNIFEITQAGRRIREVALSDGRVIVRNGVIVSNAPSVNIATIDFLVAGGDSYPFNNAPFIRIGVTYQRALFNYVTQHLGGRITARQYPIGGSGRILRRN